MQGGFTLLTSSLYYTSGYKYRRGRRGSDRMVVVSSSPVHG